MLPFARMSTYGNTAPRTHIKIYSNAQSFYVLKGTKLYGTGRNSNGELGTGSPINTIIPFLTLLRSDVQRVFCHNSSNCIFIITTDSRLYISGNASGLIAVSSPANLLTWSERTQLLTSSGLTTSNIAYMENWLDLKVNLITTSGDMYCLGTNNVSTYSSFGNGTNTNSTSIFTKVATNVQSCSGNFHIKNDGTLWGCGGNQNYWLGNNSTATFTSWVQLKSSVQKVMSGYGTMMYLSGTDLYGSGRNANSGANEFGSGNSQETIQSSKIIRSGVKDFYLGASQTYCILQDTSSNFYGTGLNSLGQLGLNDQLNRSTFTQITVPSTDMSYISGSGNIFYSTDQNVYTSGSTTCGLGGTVNNASNIVTTITQLTVPN